MSLEPVGFSWADAYATAVRIREELGFDRMLLHFDSYGASLTLRFTGQWTERELERLAVFIGKHDLDITFAPDGAVLTPRVR